ncbi:MAG: DUF11 domain-containing protein, partial [Aureibaculum sp.]
DDGGAAYNSGTGLWTIGTLNNGATATLNITATVDAGTSGSTITNTITVVSAYQSDSNTTADDPSEDITVGNGADLITGKTVDNGTPNEGDTIIYTLTLTNNGPAQATNLILTDQLPAGVTYVSDDGAGAYVSGTGLWTIGTLNNGATATLNITATVDVGTSGSTIINTITVVSADQTDSNTTVDDPSEDIVVGTDADLELSKIVDNATPDVTTNVIFTLAVTNNGPNQATGVVVTDLLPTGYSYVSDDGAGAYVSGTGLWTIGTLNNGDTATLNITATVNVTGNYTNIAEVTSSGNTDPDSTPGNGVTTEDDYDSVTTNPVSVSDLEITKVVDNATPNVGTDVVFTLTLTNNGPSDATGVTVSDLLPSGYTFVSDDGAGAYVSGTGIWTVPVITNGNSAILNITANVNASGVYNNITEVRTSDNLDPDSTPGNGVTTEDDYDSESTIPVPVSDVSLSKSVDNPTPNAGDNIIFTIIVSNNGPSDATGVQVTDQLPTGYTFVSDDGAGAYVAGTGIWTLPVITTGNTETLNITATVNAVGNYTNIAEVTS